MTIPERGIEESFVKKLQDLKYEFRSDISNRVALEANFREKFQALNGVILTDREFQRLLDNLVTSDVFKAARSLRNMETFTRDDGTPLNYRLVNNKNWCKNTFEVIKQLKINTKYSHHRYDVILLINGIPVVQIELKSLGISPRSAMEQIVNYKNDPGNGFTNTILCFVQLFIVSNRTDTWYFANNNAEHFAFNVDERFLPISQFAKIDNKKVTNLDQFADNFLSKCTLGEMISKYMILIASEQKLMMMRPYQIYAVKAIVDCINQGCGNGYIWHTTGSGKTLTSFKTSTLLKDNENIYKCLFVVDRKDLDRHTREEFNRFQENCVEENTNTASLIRRLLSENRTDKIIVTTIQKLGLALNENKNLNPQNKDQGNIPLHDQLKDLRNKNIVFIFDECHRSHFGETHKAISNFFPNSQLFGFTGTPIFNQNATVPRIHGDSRILQTTKDLFKNELHTYTITNAIEDKYVLQFHVEYYEPNTAVSQGINNSLTKNAIVRAILDRHDSATGNRRFNAILATASIVDAIKYYNIFKEVQVNRQSSNPEFEPLKISAIFSPPAEGNKEIKQIQDDLPQEKVDNQSDPEGKKNALRKIITDYNQQYNTNYDINKFDLYYQDVQKRIKDQHFPNRDLPNKGQEKIDITIVVDMLLTGFDSKFLNTLYVDKDLKYHGLIQAFSRTNRILNATKPYGNIVDFRQQYQNVDDAIALFSGESVDRAREIWLVDEAPVVIDDFKMAVDELSQFMLSQDLEAKPEDVPNLKGEAARLQFINKFKKVQKYKIRLDQFTDLTDEQKEEINTILPDENLKSFRGSYIEIAQILKKKWNDSSRDNESTSPEVELDFVLFSSADIDYDYIMKLISKYSKQDPEHIEVSRNQLIGLILSDANFIEEREYITEFIETLIIGENLDEDALRTRYKQFKVDKQAQEVNKIAKTYGLAIQDLENFINNIIQRKIFDGEQLTDLMEPLGLSWRKRREQELAIMAELVPLLKKRAHGGEISGLYAYEQGSAL